MRRNRHPADDLADTRAQIKQLEIREQELRDELLASDDDRVGDSWRAEVRHCEQERIDNKALVAHFGRAALKRFFKTVSFDMVVLKKRERP